MDLTFNFRASFPWRKLSPASRNTTVIISDKLITSNLFLFTNNKPHAGNIQT